MQRQIAKSDRSGCRKKHLQRGSSIVEGVIAILLICLILFGLLQVFLVYTAQEFTDYSAFRTARSLSVGFNDSLAKVEARTRTIPVSGRILTPPELSTSYYRDLFGDSSSFTTSTYKQNDSVYDYYYRLRRAIRNYMSGYRYLECEYWMGEHSSAGADKKAGDNPYDTSLETKFKRSGDTVSAEVKFERYPFRLPFAKAFLNTFDSDPTQDISSTVELKNHSKVYLED